MFGTELKNKRKEMRIKQFEMAEELDLTITHFCQLENGKSSPNLKTLQRWCEALGYKLTITEI